MATHQDGADHGAEPELTAADRAMLRRCIALAREALDAGDEPFGSVLVAPDGTIAFEDHNRVAGGDATRHPEFEIARWAAAALAPRERAASTVYTSGEHCPMCSAAHAWVGLGRIVFAVSGQQLSDWRREWDLEPGPVASLPIRTVAPHLEVAGPYEEFADEVRALHAECLGQS